MAISTSALRTLGCPQCGAQVSLPAARIADRCAFCDNALVEAAASTVSIDRVAAFRIDDTQAAARLATELSGRWLAPEVVRKKGTPEALAGVYVPFWAYDASARSKYTAEVGIHWYRTETYTEIVNGKPVTRTRQVLETEWFSTAGSHAAAYQDQLVSASNGLAEHEANELEPFDTGLAQPFDACLLAGWIAERPTIDRDSARATAHQEFADLENAAIWKFLPGDESRNVSNQTQIEVHAVRLLMLPIWVANYHHGGAVYRLLVNGQTGEVVGETPRSNTKIAALIGVAISLVLVALLATGVIP